jgi:hypothetical protein
MNSLSVHLVQKTTVTSKPHADIVAKAFTPPGTSTVTALLTRVCDASHCQRFENLLMYGWAKGYLSGEVGSWLATTR